MIRIFPMDKNAKFYAMNSTRIWKRNTGRIFRADNHYATNLQNYEGITKVKIARLVLKNGVDYLSIQLRNVESITEANAHIMFTFNCLRNGIV